MAYLLHPSGSLPYHLRAWRWRHCLWAPFHAQVRRWLTDWRPLARHLVLVGPSGGYALTAQFLESFARLDVLEPDPLARWLLRRRFPNIEFGWHDGRDLPKANGFSSLAARFPEAAFLFCNLLGQELQGQPRDFRREDWLAAFEPALAGREWGSWHDLASTSRPPDHPPPPSLERARALDRLLGACWEGGELEVVDHGTDGLCPGQPRHYAIWRLAPRRYHLIEWIGVTRPRP